MILRHVYYHFSELFLGRFRLPISSSFLWVFGFLPCSFIYCMFLCLFISFDLLCLWSPFCRLQGCSPSCLWSLPSIGQNGLVPFEGFLVGETGACVLMGGTGPCLSEGQWHVQWCVGVVLELGMAWAAYLLIGMVVFLFQWWFGMRFLALELAGLWVGSGLSVEMEALGRALSS